MRRAARILASGLGTGYAPKAPGTVGSVLGLALGLGALACGKVFLIALTLAAICLGTLSIPPAAGIALVAEAGAEHADPSFIVIDEIAGICVALLALPRVELLGAAVAFGLFRVFDIFKPGPVGWADRRSGAVWIMLDDVIAGGMAGVGVWCVHAWG